MIYRLCKILVSLFMRAVFRVKLHGRENIPKNGGALICINHASLWDVPFSAALLPRRLYFMAKSELFQNPLAGAFLRWAGGFPVRRGVADVQSIRTALSLLDDGQAVVIFPEGKRVRPGEAPVRAKAGAGMVAVKSGLPVIPVGIGGGRYRPFARKDIFIGKPMQFENREDSVETFRAISDAVLAEIRRLAKGDAS